MTGSGEHMHRKNNRSSWSASPCGEALLSIGKTIPPAGGKVACRGNGRDHHVMIRIKVILS